RLSARSHATIQLRHQRQVGGVVDAQDADAAASHIDLVDAARILREPPIGRERLIEKLQQESAGGAVMGDEDDSAIRVGFEDETKRVGAAREEMLERLTVRETHQVRSREPGGEQLRVGGFDLVISLELPGAVIDVVEIVENTRFGTAGLPDRRAGRDAAL